MAKIWICSVCGYAYDPTAGDPQYGIAPGTAFQNLPDAWACPNCGSAQKLFVQEPDPVEQPVVNVR